MPKQTKTERFLSEVNELVEEVYSEWEDDVIAAALPKLEHKISEDYKLGAIEVRFERINSQLRFLEGRLLDLTAKRDLQGMEVVDARD